MVSRRPRACSTSSARGRKIGIVTWPKKYVPTETAKDLLDLVARLMPLLLAGDHATCFALRVQYARAQVREVELTGVGFFVDFDIPSDAPRTEPKNMTGGSVEIRVEGVANGAGCLLFVRDGVIAMLEGYTYDDAWPERPVVLALENPIPLVPSGSVG